MYLEQSHHIMPVASEMIDGFWLFASIEQMECNTYLLVLSWGAQSIYLDVISTCTWRPHIAGIHRNHHFTIFQIIKYVQYQYTYLGSFIYANIDLVHCPRYFSVCLFGATRGCLQCRTVHDMGLTNALNMVPFAAILASTLDVGIAHFIPANLCTIYSIMFVDVFLQKYDCISILLNWQQPLQKSKQPPKSSGHRKLIFPEATESRRSRRMV